MARRKKNDPIDHDLLTIKRVPESVIMSEKVTEKLLDKKLTPKQKKSLKYKAAIRNYRKAVTRYKLALTLLNKHKKVLQKMKEKYS